MTTICQPRSTGITQVSVEACLRIRGVYVCHNSAFAEQLMNMYPGLDAISVEQDYMMCGGQRPLFFDHFVTESLFHRVCQNKIRIGELETKNYKLAKERDAYKARLDLQREMLDSLRDEMKKLRGRLRRLQAMATEFGESPFIAILKEMENGQGSEDTGG